jgi:hypothetical protein
MEERGKRRRGHLQRSLRPCIVDRSCERSVCNCSTSSPSENVNQRVEYAAVWGGSPSSACDFSAASSCKESGDSEEGAGTTAVKLRDDEVLWR